MHSILLHVGMGAVINWKKKQSEPFCIKIKLLFYAPNDLLSYIDVHACSTQMYSLLCTLYTQCINS